MLVNVVKGGYNITNEKLTSKANRAAATEAKQVDDCNMIAKTYHCHIGNIPRGFRC
jgi:hypothetical protein